jgi:predicted TPR repeat methyltransferase
MLYYIIGALILTIIIKDMLHKAERKDLYNRIMSKDLTEFKQDGHIKQMKSAHDRVMNKWRRGDIKE